MRLFFDGADTCEHDPERVEALHLFDGDVRSRILDLKYRNQRRLARVLANELADLLGPHVATGRYQLVTWPPTSDRRRRERGVDHGELLARHVAAFVGLPSRQVLRKLNTAPQTGAPRETRLRQVEFVAHVPRRVRGVIVVDDVVTTGATMRAATRALRACGVAHVKCCAVAATPTGR